MEDEFWAQLAAACSSWLREGYDGTGLPLPKTPTQTEVVTALAQLKQRLDASGNPFLASPADLETFSEYLLQIAPKLASTLDVRDLLEEVISDLRRVFPLGDVGLVFLYHPAEGDLKVEAAFGVDDRALGIKLKPEEGAPGRVFLTESPVLTTTIEESADFLREISNPESASIVTQLLQLQDRPPYSLLCVPFIARGKAIGSLLLEHWRDERAFTQQDVRLLSSLSDLIAIALDNGRLWQDLSRRERYTHELVAKLMSAQEDERKRIARDLHDEVGQGLSTISVQIALLARKLPADDESQKIAAGLQATIKELMNHVRNAAYAMRPAILDDLGLGPAIRWYAQEYLAAEGPQIKLDIDNLCPEPSAETETVIFRVAQEALLNAVKYSQAAEIGLSLKSSPQGICLAVQDNGVGFDPAEVSKSSRRSLGLQSMQERVALVDGSLRVSSTPGRGTTVEAWIPHASTKTANGDASGTMNSPR